MSLLRSWSCSLAVLLLLGAAARTEDSFAAVSGEVNKKVVKVFGSGGFQGLAAYGTGILVSAEGHILTVASHLLDTQDLRVHLYDGRRFEKVKVLYVEPDLDAALLKIDKVEDLPYFDIVQAAKAPLAQPGDWILAYSNQFQIATRDEPMSVQRGVIAALSKLQGRKGVFDAPYTGEVYVIDAITNNPGAGGGALTTRKGKLLGMIGKELRNTLTDTWINYAVPIPFLAKFVEQAKKGEYVVKPKKESPGGPGGYHGIILVPNVVERTPPFIEEVAARSPAAKAGLKIDDLIVYVEGEQVVTIKAFQDLMRRYRPGDAVKLEVRRVDKAETGAGVDWLITVELKLEEPPAPKVKTPPKKPGN